MTIINKEIIKAIDFIWNNKFQEAENIFEQYSSSTPRYSLHNAETAFLKSFITANEIETEIALKRLKDTKELSELCIKTLESNRVPQNYHPQNIITKDDFKNHILDCKIVLGDSLYMLAVLQITRDQKFKGCLNLRKSWKMFDATLKQVKEDEENGSFQYSQDLSECLRFGAGFFYFAISIIPQKYMKFVELVGFKADREQGLVYIRDCLNRGGIRTPFATMVILFNNLLLPRGLYNPTNQLNEAQQLIERNLERYPNGSLFQVMASHCYRKQCKIDLGLRCMELAISNYNNNILKSSSSKPPLIYNYELACCWCIKMEWNKAIPIFEELIKEDKFQIRALCALQLASCYFMISKKEKGQQILQLLIKQFCKRSSSTDVVIQRQAQRYLTNGGNFSAFELLYIRRDLAKMEKSIAQLTIDNLNSIAKKSNVFEFKHTSCNESSQLNTSSSSAFLSKTFSNLIGSNNSINKKKEDSINQDNLINDRASYLMLKGAIFKSIDLIDQSIECFDELLSMSHLITEKFYVPYTLYEMSECYYQKRNHSKSLEFLLKCNKISNYDWIDAIKVRLRVTLDQLKRDNSNNNNNDDGSDLFIGDFNDTDNIEQDEDGYSDDDDDDGDGANEKKEQEIESKKEIFYLNEKKQTTNNSNSVTSSPSFFKTNITLPSPSIIQDRTDNKKFIEKVTII